MDEPKQFTRGVLYAKDSQKNYTLNRLKPSTTLSDAIETFWQVQWDLPNKQSHHQQNIPDPCVNIVFKKDNQEIVGVISKRYSTTLKANGEIFGVKFRAGAFSLFSNIDQRLLRDNSLPLTDVFGNDALPFIVKVNNAKDLQSKIMACEDFLLPRRAQSNGSLKRLSNLIHEIENDSSITKVSQLTTRFAYSERSLQRMFEKMLGISPKWIIKKYRIQDVLSQLEDGNFNWQDLLEQHGYFDQSHFIKDFKDFIGLTPREYIELSKTS